MAENDPATDAGNPTPHHRHRRRNPLRRKETTAIPLACPSLRNTSKSKKKSKTDIAIEQAAARLAADAPPLSEGQKRRIAELFAPAINATKR